MIVSNFNFVLGVMDSPHAFDSAVAADVAHAAHQIVHWMVPEASQADVVLHLCGALGHVLLEAVELDDAVSSLERWQEAMREVLCKLAEHAARNPRH
jgi:hypothetical protein